MPGSTLRLGSTYTLAGEDTFTKTAPVGSFAQPDVVSDANLLEPIYTGDHGMGWSVYPDGWPSTYTATVEGYQPSTVLSVHDGLLDFYLHQDSNGNPVGANLSPWPGGSQYQTYGAWSFCEKVAPADSHNLDTFYQAPLLWPQLTSNWEYAESDFPEGRLDTGVIWANAHYGGQGYLDQFNMPIDLTQWHAFTQEWGPGYRSYYVDGKYIGFTSTSQVWSQPERWQLQIEPSGVTDGGTGHIYVAWVWIGTLA
jgi:hypothetical protein